jgi:hypothetical protein
MTQKRRTLVGNTGLPAFHYAASRCLLPLELSLIGALEVQFLMSILNLTFPEPLVELLTVLWSRTVDWQLLDRSSRDQLGTSLSSYKLDWSWRSAPDTFRQNCTTLTSSYDYQDLGIRYLTSIPHPGSRPVRYTTQVLYPSLFIQTP